jgi:hypothetical protein
VQSAELSVTGVKVFMAASTNIRSALMALLERTIPLQCTIPCNMP